MRLILTLFLVVHFYLSYARKNTYEPVKLNRISIFPGNNKDKDENLHEKVFSGLTIGSFYQQSRNSIIATPIWNPGHPARTKTSIDTIADAGKAFKYRYT